MQSIARHWLGRSDYLSNGLPILSITRFSAPTPASRTFAVGPAVANEMQKRFHSGRDGINCDPPSMSGNCYDTAKFDKRGYG